MLSLTVFIRWIELIPVGKEKWLVHFFGGGSSGGNGISNKKKVRRNDEPFCSSSWT